jgi:PH (Pleckstrin Homology) domain-containing protein
VRQPILYGEEMWKRQRPFPVFFIIVGVVMSVVTLFTTWGRAVSNSWLFLAYVGSGLVYGALLLYYRWRSRVEVTEEGLKVSNLLSSVVIDYDDIRSVRVQPLARHFEDSRKRLVRSVNRALMPKPALFIRLRGDEAQLAQLRKKLGAQLVAGDTVALPLPDPNAMSWEVSSRLPERTGVNLGGQRRRKRAR